MIMLPVVTQLIAVLPSLITGILSSIPVNQATATRSDALQVTSHFLTLQSAGQVTVEQPNQCQDVTGYRQCLGELRGSYTWDQENPMKNYVLFLLNGRASISAVNLTYSVDSLSETPKVSFCAAGDDITINGSFTNLKCQEVSIEATNTETRDKMVAMPFPNITSKIVMEVITQGIKASFTATSVEFFGTYEMMETTSSPVSITYGTAFTSDNNQIESQTTNSTSGAPPGPMQTSKINMLIAVVLGLMLFTIL